ncbi:carbohydrate ABC transporter permease [Dictyobacter arantiisoli]|uniref:Sugar ABC transporter permease n=1 Tax=Dictyobacter arantiisoli TaxID=2014874 RepID=A0A5A5THM5_9CHLR|nr:carbohydrate ABC transporter permease [Dictyobacter arantiisoli]GCF10563.1 sugar ABC transporter permease [Dictyobacter arantiisoli]
MAVSEQISASRKEVMRQSAKTQKNPGRHRGWTGRTIMTVIMLLFFVYFLMPLFWLLVSTTKTNTDLFATFGLWLAPNFNLWNNLHDLFTYQGGIYLKWLGNSAYYSVISAVGASFFCALAGYVFAKFRFPGRRFLFSVVLGAIMVPNTALSIPLYLLLSKVGLINTPLAIILPSLAVPFGVYLMRVYASQAVPDELLDAARVDGAGEFRIFWSIVLRVLSPGFVTVLLLTFVGTWNNYFLPLLVLNDPNYYPLTVGLAQWNAVASSNSGSQVIYTLVLTGALVSIIPLIIGFLCLQRYWQNGLTLGSVKA